MCLESTKQGFLFLEAFNQAAGKPLGWGDLRSSMEALNKKYFREVNLVDGPIGLFSFLEDAQLAGEIDLVDNGRWRLSPHGRRSLASIRQEHIDPILEPS